MFNAKENHFMNNRQTTQLPKPTVTKHLSNNPLIDNRGDSDSLPFTSFCNHNQAVENCIKLVKLETD